MADKSKDKQEIIELEGADDDELLDSDFLAEELTVASPKIIQNYTFRDQFAVADSAAASSEPVGPAADQCYRFEIINNAIDLTWNATITTNPNGCVFLSSAVIEKENGKKGKATFVICCEKKDDGKCKDCSTIVTLTVSKGRRSITKQVKVFCRPN